MIYGARVQGARLVCAPEKASPEEAAALAPEEEEEEPGGGRAASVAIRAGLAWGASGAGQELFASLGLAKLELDSSPAEARATRLASARDPSRSVLLRWLISGRQQRLLRWPLIEPKGEWNF